jgi:hypothetical protein
MPIVASDIHFRLSGGAGNSNVNASLGGAMSSTSITDNTQQNLFDDISGAESAAGEDETIANEGAAPVGETFSQPTTYSGGLALNSTTGLAPADDKGVWLKRTVTAGASAAADSATIKVEGDTAA